MMSNLPVLYTTAANGARRQWKVSIEAGPADTALIVVESGCIGGAITRTERIVASGKNLGKTNATTPLTQAEKEARALWQKKQQAIERADLRPMLAHDFSKRGHNISFPCWVQPKLDGVRALFHCAKREFLTRRGNEMFHLEPIITALSALGSALELKGIVALDGELFLPNEEQELLCGILRRKVLDPETEQIARRISFNVFDCILTNPDAPFEERKSKLIMLDKLGARVQRVSCTPCADRAQADELLNKFTADGNEGIILRNILGKYAINTRSADLQKYKLEKDDEFEIVDYTTAEGTEEGAVVWICKTAGGKTFNVRPRGTVESRRALTENARDYIGKMLTVCYQNLTRFGIPRFPRAKAIRDFE